MALIRQFRKPEHYFFRNPEHYGWLLVAASSIIVGMGLGCLFSFSVFLKPLVAEFGWARGDTAFAYTSAAVLNGLSGIVMGSLSDRYSARPIVLFGGVMLGGSLILAGHVSSLWQLYVIYGPMLGALALGTFMAPLLTNVGFWLEKNRGLAIGTIIAGQSLGGAVVPVIARHLISTMGWRDAYITLGIMAWAVILPLALLVRDAPGMAVARAASRQASREGRRAEGGVDPRKLTIVLCIAIVLCCLCMVLPVVHLVALATDRGIPAAAAVSIFGVMMLFSVISRVGVGKLADMIGGIQALLVCSGFQTVFVFWFTQMDSPRGFYAMAILFGLGYGGIIPAYAIIVREQLPVHRAGGAVGLVFFFGNLGMGAGGYLGGLLFDWSGAYTLPFAAAAGAGLGNLLVVSSLLMYLGSRRRLLLAQAAQA